VIDAFAIAICGAVLLALLGVMAAWYVRQRGK